MASLRFDLTTLRLFVSVAETGSISRAAVRENIAVSAASKRVSDLEIDVGTPLLMRLPRGVELTPAGSALLHHAVNIFQTISRLESNLSEYAQGVQGHVRMLVSKSALLESLPGELSAFVREYPNLKIDLREDQSPNIIKAVANGLIDIGVFTNMGIDIPSRVQTFRYRRSDVAIIATRDHALASYPEVSLEQAVDDDFVVDLGTAWDAILADASAKLGRPLRLRFRISSLDALCRIVAQGLALGLAPPAVLTAFTSAANLVAIRLTEPWAKRELMLCVRDFAALPPAARLMVRHLTERNPQSR